MYGLEDPIAAIATPSGPGAIGIIRVSGSESHKLLCKNLAAPPQTIKARHLYPCKFMDAGRLFDKGLVSFFHAPKSYTGQESAELYLHGGPYIMRRGLEILLESGFRIAEPGEFTRRAFLNQKLDLSSAEGVAAMVSANSEQQWQAALQTYSGKLQKLVASLRTELVAALAIIAARIDFPDEEETQTYDQNNQLLLQKTQEISNKLKHLENTYQNGRIARHGLKIVLFGPPNSGKSTLLNALLGTERALVSDEAGTTRDYLEESYLLQGRMIRLQDSAGIRDSQAKVESMGITRSWDLAKEADLVIYLCASDQPEAISQADQAISTINPRAVLKVLSKADLRPSNTDLVTIYCAPPGEPQPGLEKLKQVLVDHVDKHLSELSDEQAYLISIRQKEAVRQAHACLDSFHQAVSNKAYDEILSYELEQGVKALSEIIGEVHHEDVLDNLFSTFCVGK